MLHAVVLIVYFLLASASMLLPLLAGTLVCCKKTFTFTVRVVHAHGPFGTIQIWDLRVISVCDFVGLPCRTYRSNRTFILHNFIYRLQMCELCIV